MKFIRDRGRRLCRLIVAILVICAIWLLADLWFVQDTTRLTQSQIVPSDIPWFQLYFNASGHQSKEETRIKPPSPKGASGNTCNLPRFDPKTSHPPYVACKRRKPVEESCDLANKLLFSEPKPKCTDQRTTTICLIEVDTGGYQVKCTANVCKSGLSIGLFIHDSWRLSWKPIEDIGTLENTLRDLLKKNSSNGNYGFCFLRCLLHDNTTANQLLLMPQYFTPNTCIDATCRDAININVIWLDSTSHSHFFRSLPKSVNALRNAKENKLAHVFNYNLMQGLNGGTLQNTIALTGGDQTTKSFGNLLKLYQTGGYYVTFANDLCWKTGIRIHGMMTSGMMFILRSQSQEAVRKMDEILMSKGIDQVGISLANCEILSKDNVSNPMLDIGNRGICYNGKYQNDYLLDSMELLQTQLISANRSFFNYWDLNVAHEPTARRIQTLDDRLSMFIESLSKQDNTLTLMFGDHGLKYGPIVSGTTEGSIEVAHPVCFAIASKNLEEKLGKDKMDALRINQDRIIDIIDLRQTLLTLSPVKDDHSFGLGEKYDSHPNGLLHPINPKRFCRGMNAGILHGKCICEEGHTSHKISNDTRVKVLADFALGEINNILQDQFVSANKDSASGFGSCVRLVGKWIDNVQETLMSNSTVIELDVHLAAGSGAPQSEDKFFVVIQVNSKSPSEGQEDSDEDGSAIHLIHYERVSTYGIYDECRDEGVEGKLCICSLSNRSPPTRQWHLALGLHLAP
ncbi:uncharacterized protein [Amphiura filiformis]|uniref:uncharacterized protein n=1 Tax=Amphiura filiformis TaxID=82378 RepID=UPI003B21B4ED